MADNAKPHLPPKEGLPAEKSMFKEMRDKVRHLRFDQYLQPFVKRHELEQAGQYLYEKLENLQKLKKEGLDISLDKKEKTARVVEGLKSHLKENRQLLAAFYRERYGVGEMYVDDVLLPKLLFEVQYLLDNQSQFKSAQIDFEAILANHRVTVRNNELGLVLIAANESAEQTVLNLAHGLMAGNVVVLHLGEALAHESLVALFKSFAGLFPDRFRLADQQQVEQLEKGEVALVLSIGSRQYNQQLSKLAGAHGSPHHGIGRRNNLAIVANKGSVSTFNELIGQLHDNRMELNGDTHDSIDHIFVHADVRDELVEKLALVVEREYEFLRHYEYYGDKASGLLQRLLDSQINQLELAVLPHADGLGHAKPLILVDPQDADLATRSTPAPVFVVHTYHNFDALADTVNAIDRVEQVGNIHFLASDTDVSVGEHLALRLRCRAFHFNGIETSWRTSSGHLHHTVPDVSAVSGFNGISLFSKKQLAVESVLPVLDRINAFPVNDRKVDLLKRFYRFHRVPRRYLGYSLAFGAFVSSYLLLK